MAKPPTKIPPPPPPIPYSEMLRKAQQCETSKNISDDVRVRIV